MGSMILWLGNSFPTNQMNAFIKASFSNKVSSELAKLVTNSLDESILNCM